MNNNWIETPTGWRKVKNSKTKGSAGFFAKESPPMRDAAGRPMRNYDEIDTALWIKEVNERDAKENNDGSQ